MKQVFKKSAAILLILCMIITLIPQYAFAGDVTIQSRSNILPLGNPSQWFQFIKINSNGEYESEGAYADIKNYTNTAEGWEWYPDGDSDQGYAKKTLVLKGIQLDTSDPIAITLPDEATIILKDGTTNVVRSTYNGTNESFGIYCYGSLTIEGSGTLQVRGGADVSSLEYSGGIHSTGTLEIKDGTINAECGSGEVESKAISSNAMIDISGGTITATGGEAINISYGIYGQIVKISNGTIHAAGGEAINASYGIYGQTLKFSDGTTYAKAEEISSGQYFAVYSSEQNGLDDSGMKVLHKNGNNYTVPVTKEDNGKFYFVDTDYAFDIRIQKAPPASAEIDNVSLSGVVGMPLSGTVTINLSGDTFVSENLAVESDVTNWFAGLSSLSGPVYAVIESFTDMQAVIKFIGTPKSVYSEQILITIPAGNLTGNKAITVTPNENARFNIQNPPAGATLSNSLILGAVGQSMNGEVTLYLSGCDFKDLGAGNDVSSWFANSPAGLNATVVSIDNKNPIEKLLVRIAGSPLSALEAPMEITIPADKQTSDQPIPVTLNNNARYHITETWDGRRTSMLDLTAESVSYWSTGEQWTSQNPILSDILDSGEGWTWYRYGSEELNYHPKTLVLEDITLETGDLVGIRLPADSIIILKDNTENTVKCLRNGFSTGDTRGIEGMGALSIRGNNGSLYATGGNGDTKTSSVGIFSVGDLTISGGEVEAVGGQIAHTWVSAGLMSRKNIIINGSSIVTARSEESVYSDSQGIRADNYVTFSGESITYAKGNDFAVYGAYGINDSGLTIRQNVDGNYIGATTRWTGFCYKDSSNENATDILISKRQALLSNVTVSGKPGAPLSGEDRLTVSLIYSSFRNDLTVNQNAASWFSNLPPGAQAKVASIDGNRRKVTLAFSGTPVSGSTGPIVVIIPAEQLTDGIILNANVNQYASFDISSNNTAPSASISEKTISGEIGKALPGSATMTINLTDSAFITLNEQDDISNWFTNLPEGLTVTLLSIAEDGFSASIGFSGTPLEECERAMEITIPADKLSINMPLNVTENSNAKYHITEETTAGLKKRTSALDLTVKELWYKSQTETTSADPTSEDITNSVEGWKWYLYGDEEKGYSPKTLELSGINLDTNSAVAAKLPAAASIVLVDGTINRVKSTYHDRFNTYGIEGNGALTIKGSTGELHATGGTTTENNSIGILADKTILIEGGNIYATGGVSSSSYPVVMSVGIVSNQNIIFSGGTIYANASAAPLSRAVYTLEITDTGMQAFQKKEGSYSQGAQVQGGYYIYGTDQTPATDIKITAVPSIPGPSFGGEGTEADPYLITSKDELKEMAQLVNEQNAKYGGKHYRVTANITLNDDINNDPEVWTPIGKNNVTAFTGSFDGDGHAITGLYMNGSASYAGLFGYLDSGSTVRNIGIKGGQIYASGGNSYAGGIAAYNRGGRIEDCFNTASIGGTQSGGITGYNEMGHIQDSYNTGQVVGIIAGGIAGVNQDAEMTIVNCYNTGSVNAVRNSNTAYAGGITGKNYSGTIKNSYNAGAVSTVSAGAGSVYLGGVSAVNNSSTLVDVYWLDSALLIDSSYGDGNTGSAEAKTSEELKAMAQTLNHNAAGLSGQYNNLASWKDDTKHENGGYPLFGTVTNYTLTVSGGGTGATADGSYAAGTIVSIHAGTKEGYTFTGWTTAGSGVFENTSNAETTFTMPEANTTITANWKAKDEPGQGPGPSKPSRPTPSVKTEDTNVLINGKSQSAGKSETTTGSDGKTLTTVTVDSDKLKSLLSAEKEGAKVTIPIKDGVNAGEGKLTGEMVKSMEDKSAILVIQKGASSYTLPAAEINISEISKKLGANVSLEDITVTIKISQPTNTMEKVVESAEKGKGFTIVAPAIDFTITCTYGGKSVNSASFNSYVERTVAIPEGVDPSKITTGIVVEPSGTIYHVPTRVTVINGKYYAVINSLTNSTYSVVWNPIEFSDMTKHWAKESVNNMGSRMVVTGVGNNSYDPGRNMTRAEFAAIMVRALGLAPESGASTFSDVKATSWYSGYIKTAVSYGIIKGYDNGNFGPNDTITREQAMAMLSRAMKVTGLKVNLTDQSISKLGSYTDSAVISTYAKESVAACLETGITAGRGNNTIAPKSFITRAEVAVMAERLLKKSDLI